MARDITIAAMAPMALTSASYVRRSGRHGEDGVAIAHRMYRVDRARIAVVGHLRDLRHLRLGELRVGGDDADGGVRRRLHDDAVSAHHRGHGIAVSLAIFAARSGDDLAGLRINDIAHRVDRDDRADDDACIAGSPALAGAEARTSWSTCRRTSCRWWRLHPRPAQPFSRVPAPVVAARQAL